MKRDAVCAADIQFQMLCKDSASIYILHLDWIGPSSVCSANLRGTGLGFSLAEEHQCAHTELSVPL